MNSRRSRMLPGRSPVRPQCLLCWDGQRHRPSPRTTTRSRSPGARTTAAPSRKLGRGTSSSGSSSPAPWCPNCTRMEQDSFSHPAIRGHARQSFVPVKLRADANEELALHFELSGLPATVIVAPSREVLAVRQGYLGPERPGGRSGRLALPTCEAARAGLPRTVGETKALRPRQARTRPPQRKARTKTETRSRSRATVR